MSFWRYIYRSAVFHWRTNAAVALGVAAATAVLTGALLVGDSVRGSLRSIAVSRLGRVDEALIADRFFHAGLAEELEQAEGFGELYESAVPAIVFPSATAEAETGGKLRRAAGVTVVGCDERFWELDVSGVRPSILPKTGEIVLNEELAGELHAKTGDLVTLRVDSGEQVAADSTLGKKSGRVKGVTRLKVVDVIPAEGLGRFSIRANQTRPQNAYVSLETLQAALGRRIETLDGLEQALADDEKPNELSALRRARDEDDVASLRELQQFLDGEPPELADSIRATIRRHAGINTILVAGNSELPLSGPAAEQASARLQKMLPPSLDDFGFSVEHVRATFNDPQSDEQRVVYDYYSFTSDRMVFPQAAAQAAREALKSHAVQPVITYLANTIERTGKGFFADTLHTLTIGPVAYSTVSAVDSTAGLGPLLDGQGKPIELNDGEIAVNSWTAADQDIEAGDSVRLTYYLPETSGGEHVEQEVTLKVAHIVPITRPSSPYGRSRPAIFSQPPTIANDPHLTPEVEGITDQDSINNWESPFDLNEALVRREDDDYWSNYRLTPKAFVNFEMGKKLWSSRFGEVTSLRVPAGPEVSESELRSEFLGALREQPAGLGFAFLPLKREGLESSSGTTPFDVLFLMLSMFLIASALMLVSLLFRLGVERRAEELGVLLAAGVRRGRVARLLVMEGAMVAAVGGLLGLLVGIAYAWLLIYGLNTVWVGAVATGFLQFYWTWPTLVIGYAAGVVVSIATIAVSLFATRGIAVRRLLAGRTTDELADLAAGRAKLWPWALGVLAGILLLAAIGLGVGALFLGGEAQAGAFMGCGAAVLTALLLFVWVRARYGHGVTAAFRGAAALPSLAARNAQRNPSRSTLTIGLIAAAGFLIIAVSAFRLRPTEEGTGGFQLVGESSEPVVRDLYNAAARRELLLDKADELADTTIFSLRVQPGDDASCRNLFQSVRPRVLGVPHEMVEYFDREDERQFSWAGSDAASPEEEANPWRLLERSWQGEEEPVPVVLDKNTAMYSLQKYFGVGEIIDVVYEDGRIVKFRIVGLLNNSVLQGSLFVSEKHFKQLYPRISGYRFFLIKTPPESADGVEAALEERLSDQGFSATPSAKILNDLLAVQNTYLLTFQILGGLGLLLGTFGLATVQLRSVLERRAELALMRAQGFRRGQLAWLVIMEILLLLLAGLTIGAAAAAVAVVPHMFVPGGATPPWLLLAALLLSVLAAGILAGLIAVRVTLRAPIVPALRGE